MGNIGKALAKRAAALDMRVHTPCACFLTTAATATTTTST
jgi:phosphoglycerate dehydrogenase-like enzyme